MTMDEKKDLVLRYLQSKGAWATPTEIGMKALGCNYFRASAMACNVLKNLVKEKLVEHKKGGKYRLVR